LQIARRAAHSLRRGQDRAPYHAARRVLRYLAHTRTVDLSLRRRARRTDAFAALGLDSWHESVRTGGGSHFAKAQIVIESWLHHFNTIRPHESLGYKPPAPEVFVPAVQTIDETPTNSRRFLCKELQISRTRMQFASR
jgi:hypothetical protein